MYSPNRELRSAILERLNEDPKFRAGLYFSKNEKLPIVVVGEISKTQIQPAPTTTFNTIVNFNIYDDQNTFVRVELAEEWILKQITLSGYMNYNPLILDGFVITNISFFSSTQVIGEEEKTHIVQLQFRIEACNEV